MPAGNPLPTILFYRIRPVLAAIVPKVASASRRRDVANNETLTKSCQTTKADPIYAATNINKIHFDHLYYAN